jgi:hypothetical protein
VLERLAHEVARRAGRRRGLGRDDQAVREHGLGDGLDVVRRDEAAAVGERARLATRRSAIPARGLAPR